MAVETRPVDTISKDNLFIGLPIVLFERLLPSGAYDVPRNLGVLDSAELAKAVEVAQFRNKTSGLSVLEREVVRLIEPTLTLGMFNFEPENMRLLLASKSFTEVTTSTVVVVDDEFTVPDDFTKFGALSNRAISTEPLTDLDPKTVTSEAVGTGDGVLGTTSGDFALDYPILVIGDITAFTVGVNNRLADLVAGAPGAGQIGVVVGAVATSGFIDFEGTGNGVVPAAAEAVVATYTPSFTFANLTDYTVDPFEGRLRILGGSGQGGEFKTRAGQTLIADYSYVQPTETQLKPFTQSSFEGRATIKQLTDVGVNFIWDVPVVSIRVNDDALSWNADDFATGALTMNLLADPSAPATPFGVWRHFPETPAAC